MTDIQFKTLRKPQRRQVNKNISAQIHHKQSAKNASQGITLESGKKNRNLIFDNTPWREFTSVPSTNSR